MVALRRSHRVVITAALALAALTAAPIPSQAQMSGVCMVPEVLPYPGAQRASAPMLGMRGGTAHNVSIWGTSDGLPQVIAYYRSTLGAEGFVDSTPSVSQTMAGPPQEAGAGATLINSAEFSRDGRQFVFVEGTSPGFLLALGCSS
jgi:hypothetical protein